MKVICLGSITSPLGNEKVWLVVRKYGEWFVINHTHVTGVYMTSQVRTKE